MPGEPVTHIRFGSGKITAFNPPRPEAIREKKVAAARRTKVRYGKEGEGGSGTKPFGMIRKVFTAGLADSVNIW